MIITKTNSSLSWNAEKDGCIRCSNILMGQLIIIQCEEWKHKRYKDTDSNALSLWKKDYTQFRIVLVWWIHSHTSQALRQNALHYKNEISSNAFILQASGANANVMGGLTEFIFVHRNPSSIQFLLSALSKSMFFN